MAHKIIIMHDRGEYSAGASTDPLTTSRHQQVLEAAASEMAIIGPRFFKAVKSTMVRNVELPEDIREIGDSQMLVLHSLVKGRQLSSDLAERFNVTNPTMTRIVESLVNKGYVERQHAVGDRRCIFLQLTDKGEDVGKCVEQNFHDAIVRFLSPPTEEQLADIVKAHRHLASILPDASAEPEVQSAESSRMSRRAERANRHETMRRQRANRRGHRNHLTRTA